jgi:hypothetical protein
LLAITPFALMSFDSEVLNPAPPTKKENKNIDENYLFGRAMKGYADFTMI